MVRILRKYHLQKRENKAGYYLRHLRCGRPFSIIEIHPLNAGRPSLNLEH